jgi:hypothetical protein
MIKGYAALSTISQRRAKGYQSEWGEYCSASVIRRRNPADRAWSAVHLKKRTVDAGTTFRFMGRVTVAPRAGGSNAMAELLFGSGLPCWPTPQAVDPRISRAIQISKHAPMKPAMR